MQYFVKLWAECADGAGTAFRGATQFGHHSILNNECRAVICEPAGGLCAVVCCCVLLLTCVVQLQQVTGGWDNGQFSNVGTDGQVPPNIACTQSLRGQ